MAGSLTSRRAYDRLDSTNAEALRLAEAGERGPLWVDTEQQTLGRGRSGRHWISEPGNLMTSLLFVPDAPIAVLHQLSLLAGVAVFDAISEAAAQENASIQLKWPNDLMLAGAKTGGILIESSTFAGDTVAVIGIGLNVVEAPVVEGVPTAFLKSVLGEEVGPDRLRTSLAHRMDAWLKVWSGGQGFPSIRTAWLERGPALDTPMTIHAGNDTQTGHFAGLDEQGSLLLKSPSGEIRCYTFGDVSLLG